MLTISEPDLLAAVGLSSCALDEVRSTLCGRGYRPAWDPGAIELAPAAEQRAVIAAADALDDTHIDFTDGSVGRSRLYGLNYLGVLAPLVRAYVLTGSSSYVRTWDRLFTSWYQSRGKGVGEWPGLDLVWYSLGVWARAMRVVEALSAFGDDPSLSDAGFTAMLGTLVGGARWTAEEHDTFRHGNWQLVCALELFHAAAFLPEAPERSEWLDLAQGRLADHLELGFYADGGHYERSPSYHLMCLEALQRAATIGEQYLGIEISTHPRFRQANRWVLEMATQQGWMPHWQDSGLMHVGLSVLRGSYLTLDADLAAAANRWVPRAQVERELATLPRRPGRGGALADHDAMLTVEPSVCRSRCLATSGYVILTGAGGDPYLAMNAGPFADHELETHSHDAVLDIVLSSDGQALVWEGGGPEDYDDAEYYSWYKSGRAHSGVTVPGRTLSRDRQVRIVRFETFAPIDVACAEHRGYGRRITRQVLMVRGPLDYYLLIDEVEPGDEPWEWSLISPGRWVRTDTGFRAGEDVGLTVALCEDMPSVVETGRGRIPSADSQAPYGELHALRLRPVGDRLVSMLAPTTSTDEWRLSTDGDGWQLRQPGGLVDSGTDRTWLRRDAAGAAVSGCGWDGADRDGVISGEFVRSYEIDYATGVHASVTSSAATTVRVVCPPTDRVRLNGVVIDVSPVSGGVEVELVSAGTWTISAPA